MKKIALITGITGQDGSYLNELLLEKNYEVHGLVRRSSLENTKRINKTIDEINIHYGDITDPICVSNLITKIKPTEVYNLAAQSDVKISFDQPYHTALVDALGTLNILESVRVSSPKTKIYQASTSELYGLVQAIPQNETTPFYPRSPYGVAKIYGYWIIKNYRESYNLFACNGILFNHESPRRGDNFVTKKVIKTLVNIKKGKTNVLKIGNLDAKRDWGYAKEYVEGMWLMLQKNNPEDYVLATNETHSVRELIEETCKLIGYEIEWIGNGINEKGYDKKTKKLLVEIDEQNFRPSEVDILLGDYSKIYSDLGWEPKVKFRELIKIMTDYEINENENN